MSPTRVRERRRGVRRADRRAGAAAALAAGGALLPGAARARGGGLLAAHAVPARPRQDRPLEGVQAPDPQDAGVRPAPRRPLPHAPDPHARGDDDLAHGGTGAAAERGPGRGDRARARPGPSAVRAHRRGGARRLPARAVRVGLSPLRAVAADRRAAGAGAELAARVGGGGPEPDRARCAKGSPAIRAGRSRRPRWRAGSCA